MKKQVTQQPRTRKGGGQAGKKQLQIPRNPLPPRQQRSRRPPRNGWDQSPSLRDFDPDRAQQIGNVVATRLTRVGMSDLRSHRMAWIAGYTFVGNGTNGAVNAVLFQTATSTYLLKAQGAGSSGFVPIVGSDAQLGATYVNDVEKHYARKVIKRMWIHVRSLQPSTTNNMMAVIAPFRGGGGAEYAIFEVLATAAEVGNTLTQVSSMKGNFSVDSFQSKSVEITSYIGGGSGAKQNEFDLSTIVSGNSAGSIVNPGVATGVDGDGDIPACFTLAGNCTTAALQNTKVHEIVIEQEVDLLDYIGGMNQVQPIA